jgi:putative DNA primase/helicase
VLYLAGEEDPGTHVRPRLVAAGADLSRVHSPGADAAGGVIHLPSLSRDLSQIRDYVVVLRLVLVVVDPLVCCMGDTDLNHEGQVRAVLDRVQQMCIAHGVALVATRHLKKDRSGPRITHGLGSTGIGACARSVLVIDHPDLGTERRVIRVVKGLAGPRVRPAEYHLDYAAGAPVVAGLRELRPQDDDGLGEIADPVERDVMEDARRLLLGALAGGWVRATLLMAEASASAISERSLRKAKKELGVPSRRVTDDGPPYSEWGTPVQQSGAPLPPIAESPVQSRRTGKKPRKSRAKTT